MIVSTVAGLQTRPPLDGHAPVRKIIAASLCAFALLACLTAPARAGYFLAQLGNTVIVTAEQEASGETATIRFTGLPAPLSVYSAPELLSGTFGAAHTAFSNVLFYCTDLYNYSATPATYTVGYLTSSHQPSGINDLTINQLNKIATLISGNYTDRAATQLAIWTVEYASAFSFTDASNQVTGDVATYLHGLDGSAPANMALYQLQDHGVQGFAFVAPVPEPASIALLAAALIGIRAVRRRPASTTTTG